MKWIYTPPLSRKKRGEINPVQRNNVEQPMTETVRATILKSGCSAPALGIAEARARVLAAVDPVREVETLSLRRGLGRVLAQDMVSPIDVPAHTNAAVDGYALAAAGLPAASETVFRVIGTAWAGRPFTGGVEPGECVRVMTGAPMPQRTDTVVMQEHVTARGETVAIHTGHRRGENVRVAGEDIARGELALPAGKRLMAAELGMLASLGLAEVSVFRRLRVALFSTGDELRGVGEALAAGEIYDSNRYTLYGMLTRLDVEAQDLGVVPDDRAAVRQALLAASANADVVITSGGVSVGAADYVRETLDALGRIDFWQIAMRPGRPLTFGRMGNATFFGLPGNPVAVMVTFYQIVQPALLRMMGAVPTVPITFRVRCATRFKHRPGRTDFMRGILERDANGDVVVRNTGDQGSGILSSMSRANCFVILPPECTEVEPGGVVEVQYFDGIG